VALGIPWQSWAPPLAPPTAGGLPEDQAQAIADAWWDESPHLAAALMWEAYAATLPQTATVQSVHTGMQSVAYYPPIPGGDFGLAVARAEYHRSFVAFSTAELHAPHPPSRPWFPPPLWVDDR
jgi:hypothetical protein